MKVSELLTALQKVQQVAGDIPVVLKHLEDGAESALLSIGVHIDPTSSGDGGQVELEHGQAPEAPPQEQEAPAPPAG